MSDLGEDIPNKHESEQILQALCPNTNISEEIKTFISKWPFSSLTELQEIRNDLKKVVSEIKGFFFLEGVQFKVDCAIHCLVFCSLSDSLITLARELFKEQDLKFYDKCRELSGYSVWKGTSEEFCVLPYTAAIVELSLLDTHESPLEKLNCLCTAFDMVYAEIKLHMISMISKYSEKENEIPVLNNNQLLPIMEVVIAKSKLLYFCSNLFFVEYFSEDILQKNDFKRNILDSYRLAHQRILQFDLNFLDHNFKKKSSLSISEAMEAVMDNDFLPGNNLSNINKEYRKQYSAQILKSTEANYVP